jgi:NAD(P)-dependent dehydrogenase (short-subunit alcohol dehydrogenase family)
MSRSWGRTTQFSTSLLKPFARHTKSNFFGALRLTRTPVATAASRPPARIVNVSSILGSLTLHSDPSKPLVSEYKSFAYGSSKTLLNAFTVYIAHALRGTQIKVNSAHPGWDENRPRRGGSRTRSRRGRKNQRATGTAGCKRSYGWLLPPRRVASLVETRPLPED